VNEIGHLVNAVAEEREGNMLNGSPAAGGGQFISSANNHIDTL